MGWALTPTRVDEACHRLDAAVDAFHTTQDWWGLATALSTRGQLALVAGEHAAAGAMLEEALAAAETVDNDWLRAQILDMLGLEAARRGDWTAARNSYGAAAQLHTRMLDYEGSSYCLSGLGGLAFAKGKPEVSARLIGASAHVRKSVATVVWPGMQSIADAQRAAVTAVLGTGSFTASCAEGARLSLPDALGYGLAATAAEAVSDPFPAWTTRLRSPT